MGSCATTDDRAQISAPPFYGSLRSPITGAPRARKLKLFSNMARRNPFSSPTKSTCAGSWRSDDDRARISFPPLLRLVPQSDHGSAACAETEAFFQYGPPQSFFQLSWLALQKARREVGATIGPTKSTRAGSWRKDDDRAPQSDHGRAARAETEAFFQYGPPQSFFELTWLALQKARAREVGATMMTVPRARKLKLFSNMARRNPFSK